MVRRHQKGKTGPVSKKLLTIFHFVRFYVLSVSGYIRYFVVTGINWTATRFIQDLEL